MYRLMTILRRWRFVLGGALLLASAAAGAQLLPGGRPALPTTTLPTIPAIPRVNDRIGDTTAPVRDAVDPVTGRLDPLRASTGDLANARVSRLEELVRANRERLEMTDFGPAVRGEVIAIDPDQATLAAALDAGFRRIAE